MKKHFQHASKSTSKASKAVAYKAQLDLIAPIFEKAFQELKRLDKRANNWELNESESHEVNELRLTLKAMTDTVMKYTGMSRAFNSRDGQNMFCPIIDWKRAENE